MKYGIPWLVGLVLVQAGCSSDTDSTKSGTNSAQPACTALATEACVGPSGCDGVRTCQSDGASYTACECPIIETGNGLNEDGRAPSFMRGINLGNRLEPPNEGEWGPALGGAEFGYVASRGFDHIRLPVRFSGHAGAVSPFTIAETFFRRVDWAINNALKAGLSVVIDMHNYSELVSDPSGHRERFLGLWAQIAERYAGFSERLAFELLNEPNGALDGSTWSKLAADAISLIRATNPSRDIIVDGVDFSATRSINLLQLPSDPHVVASVHVYEPSLFTFQGQSWMTAEWGTTGVVFPGPPATPIEPVAAARSVPWVAAWFDSYNTQPAEINPSGPRTITDQFESVSAYVQRTGLRMYNGEWGAHNGGDLESRVRWMRMVRQASEQRSIGWCVWDDNSSMQLYDPASGKWDEALVTSLFD